MDSSDLLKLLLKRRTTHYLGKDRELDNQVVIKILREALLVAPSFFNAQTTRIVLLLDDENEKLWELVKECLAKHSKDKSLGLDTMEKLNGFKQANGTILFFEDRSAISHLREIPRYNRYQTYFDSWSEQTNAIHQYVVWAALCAQGLGVALQHYNPLIDQEIAAKWNIDSNWQLIAQLVFGKPMGKPKEKTSTPFEQRVFIYG
ncbi:nitroreductase [Trichoderma sp. SZMC 28012]